MELYGLKLNLIKERKHREKTIEVNKELMKEKRISQSQKCTSRARAPKNKYKSNKLVWGHWSLSLRL